MTVAEVAPGSARTSSRAVQIKRRSLTALAFVAVGVTVLLGTDRETGWPGAPVGVVTLPTPSAPAMTDPEARDVYGKLALAFVPNVGQIDPRVRYSAHATGASFYFTPNEAVFAFSNETKGSVLRLAFLGANPQPKIEGERVGPGRVNYLIGSGPREWRTGLPTYGQVVYRDLWPGVDMVFRGAARQLKYEFVLHPGATVEDIRLAYRGAGRLSVSRTGDLLTPTSLGVLHDERPRSYQEIGGRRVPVESRFVLDRRSGGQAYGFGLGTYDPRRTLVIDPGLAYSTFLGGELEQLGLGIAVDSAGNAYVSGYTGSGDFPVTAGAFDPTVPGGGDVFVTKLDAAGSALVYSTYLGGSDFDSNSAIALDSAGNAYVTGVTGSADFPVTPGAFDETPNVGGDAFVTKLNAAGSALVYSTYLGGTGQELGFGIAIDSLGNAYVTGHTNSADLPVTPGTFDSTYNGGLDAFVTKLNAAGSALVYSTYLGGTDFEQGFAIAVGSAGNAYVTGVTGSADFPITAGAFDPTQSGFDAFVTRLNTAGSALVYSTFLGGTSFERGFGIAVDAAGNAYVTGDTGSADFPVTPGAFDPTHNGVRDAYVTKLNGAGSALVYSTYLSGSSFEQGFGIAVDAAGNAYVTGDTGSADFPVTDGAFDTTFNGGLDAFVTKLDTSGSALVYSTYLGGSAADLGHGIAVDSAVNAYVTGETSSADFPVTPGAFDTTYSGAPVRDAFVTKLSSAAGPPGGGSPPGAGPPPGSGPPAPPPGCNTPPIDPPVCP